MAGYSGTPLPQKLGIKPGAQVAILKAPAGFDEVLKPLPAGVQTTSRLPGFCDVVLYFCDRRSDLDMRFAALGKVIFPKGSLWIAWPKKSSGKRTDLDENIVRAVGLGAGLVDVKVCAIDETWSGLKFVVRVANRPR